MELRSVDPVRNRFRRYSISVQYTLGGGDLIITWGRVGAPPRQRVEAFRSLPDLQRRYTSLLARRRRHGYEPAAEAQDITPRDLPALTVDRTSRFTTMLQANGLLGLFDSHLHAFVVRDIDPELNPDILRTLSLQASKAANHALATASEFTEAA